WNRRPGEGFQSARAILNVAASFANISVAIVGFLLCGFSFIDNKSMRSENLALPDQIKREGSGFSHECTYRWKRRNNLNRMKSAFRVNFQPRVEKGCIFRHI